MNPSDQAIREYAAAASLAATFELKCRLVADKTPGLEKAAHGGFKKLVEALIDEFADELSPDDAAHLERSKRLRDKIIHSDFHDARDILRELSTNSLPGGTVHQIDLETGAIKPVADSSSTADGRVLGWLFELGGSGAFLAAQRVLNRAIDIVNELAWAEVRRAAKKQEG